MTGSSRRPIDDFRWLPETLAAMGRTSVPSEPHRIAMEITQSQTLSAIRWGDEPVDVVYLHGGGQNAHTWDLVAALVEAPGLAVDLPGHGHSSWREDKDYRPVTHAQAVADALAGADVHPKIVVGMSLGGLTAIELAKLAPQYVPDLVLVDILPQLGVHSDRYDRSKLGQVALIDGPRVFESLEDMEAAALAVTNPMRPLQTLRRGVWHNSIQLEDGTWRWRYDDLGASQTLDHSVLWESLATIESPVALVKGGLSPLLTEPMLDRLHTDRPDVELTVAPQAGHAVQSDAPELVAQIIRRRLDRRQSSSSEAV